ncbi:unnamed protein product [Callosobruchus maculatus]|uniref:Uncharacterized protein n=1 Tax=Callosobruchus maculatus TaxID=64391 RepID=A0A653CYD9_CALMS|nr:unnamed protein product [Callosobruchus maculatus]
MAMEYDNVMILELGEDLQIDSPRREEKATAGQRRGGSTQGGCVGDERRPC